MSSAGGEAEETADPKTASSWKVLSPGGVARTYLFLLPLSAVAAFYCLVADRFIAYSAAELARASYGWPFNWVTQDLSRYEPIGFPATIDFNWQRNWSDPVATSYDWLMFTVDTLLVGVPVTVLFYAVVFFSKRIAASRKRSA